MDQPDPSNGRGANPSLGLEGVAVFRYGRRCGQFHYGGRALRCCSVKDCLPPFRRLLDAPLEVVGLAACGGRSSLLAAEAEQEWCPKRTHPRGRDHSFFALVVLSAGKRLPCTERERREHSPAPATAIRVRRPWKRARSPETGDRSRFLQNLDLSPVSVHRRVGTKAAPCSFEQGAALVLDHAARPGAARGKAVGRRSRPRPTTERRERESALRPPASRDACAR